MVSERPGEAIMKSKLFLFMSVVLANFAHADLGYKAPLKADFHSLIVNSEHERNALANGVNESIVHNKTAKRKPLRADKQRVTDFVDVEIGWGEAPQMVDRRFDSIGEAVIDVSASSKEELE